MPEEFVWRFGPGFFLSKLAGEVDAWVRWAAEEKLAWIEEYEPNPKNEFEKSWLPRPWLYLVIVAQGTDGFFYVWDGNHRIGVALTAGRKTVPDIVGYRTAAASRPGKLKG